MAKKNGIHLHAENTTNIGTKIIKIKTKNIKQKQKIEFFYEMQNNKDSDGTASYKHTKQQIFNMES